MRKIPQEEQFMDEISDLLKSGKYEEKTSNAPVILSEELVGLVGSRQLRGRFALGKRSVAGSGYHIECRPALPIALR